jgi:hypothetical protein
MIWCFIKFFQREEYADAFVSGSLYLNTLKYFKDLESASGDGRADPTEAVSMWLQPHDVEMTITAPGFEDIRIDKTDLAAPVSFSHAAYERMHLLCLYAIHSDESSTVKEASEWRRPIDVDRRCLDFGRFTVMVAAKPFLERVRSALPPLGYQARGKLVRYYDDASFHGEIPAADVPFMKQKRFGYQREFRLCVYPKEPTERALTIDIGALSGFCRKMNSDQVIHQWLEFKAAKG